MIHYHGLPITPATAAYAAVKGGHAFVSFRYADQLSLPTGKDVRALVMRDKIEANQSAKNWERKPVQMDVFA